MLYSPVQIPDDNGISMQLLLGYVGLINVIFLAPVLICLVSTNSHHRYS